MWIVDEIEVRDRVLFEWAYEPVWCVEIRSCGVTLIDAIDYADFFPNQGFAGYYQGDVQYWENAFGQVSIRRLGSYVVFAPDFEDLRADYPDLDGRIPPYYINEVGAPLFTRKAWSQMQKLSEQVPDMMSFPAINSREVVQLLQWNAPEHILGQCPNQPSINPDLLIAVAEGEIEAEVDTVDRLLDYWFKQPEPVEICNQEGDVLPLKFFLDRIDYPEWTPVVRVSDSMCIRINQGPLLRLKVE